MENLTKEQQHTVKCVEEFTGKAFNDSLDITELILNGKNIEDITPLAKLTHLIMLDIRNNYIVDLSPISELTHLEQVFVDEIVVLTEEQAHTIHCIEYYTGVSFENSQNITELNLAYKSIEDISPLAEMTKLEVLKLSGNHIKDLTPLAGLTNLILLDLDDNEIRDVSPLVDLSKLMVLYLGNNEIEDPSPLSGLTKLARLRLKGNRIEDTSQLAGLAQALISD